MQVLGRFGGTPMVRIELQGCDVRCAWCSVPETHQLHTEPNRKPRRLTAARRGDRDGEWRRPFSKWAMLSVEEILGACSKFRQKHVVVTGGEPLLHDVLPLAQKLLSVGYRVQIETSGTREVIGVAQQLWYSVSPKFHPTLPLKQSTLQRADEIIYPVLNSTSIPRLQSEVIPHLRKHVPVYLHVVNGDARLVSKAMAASFSHNYLLTSEYRETAVAM
jgi:7-carboxy-7-deazaguanine synthase